jgi:peroxiredoxin
MLKYSAFSSLTIGKPAPDFSLIDLQGEPHTLSELRGRLVIVYFWSAECPSVERTDHLLEEWLAVWGKRVVALPVASNSNEGPELLSKVAFDRSLPVVLRDAGRHVADAYGALTTPQFYLIDENGVLRYQGGIDDTNFRNRTPTHFYLREAVEALLAGRNPDPAESAPYGCTIVRFK